jgi:ParB-like chromosome segregation protein Spo0J
MTSVPADSKALAEPLLPFHPIAEIFPLIGGTELDDLVADIRDHGLHDPIVMFEGKILDGRHRYRSCMKAKVEPKFLDYVGDDPIGFVISKNLRRRNLTTSERARIAAKLANMPAHRPSNKPANLPTSQAVAAKMLNVSERSVRSAVAILKTGTPELQHAVEQDDIPVSKGAEIAKLPAAQQADAIRQRSRRPGQSREANKTEAVAKTAEIAAAISNIVAILTDHLPEEAQRSLIDNFRAAGPAALICEIEDFWRKLRPELFKRGEDADIAEVT